MCIFLNLEKVQRKNFKEGIKHEANLSTKQPETEKQTRISDQNVDQEWSAGFETQTGQGPGQADCE